MKNPQVFCPKCEHPWMWHNEEGCYMGSAGKDGGCQCEVSRQNAAVVESGRRATLRG